MIGIVGCSALKQSEPCEARHMYVGQLFIKSRTLFELMGIPWAILSAKHGLVMPDERIAPYDLTLNTMSAYERRRWNVIVKGQMERAFPEGTVFYVTAGAKYREALESFPHHAPLRGLGIGSQLGELTRLIKERRK